MTTLTELAPAQKAAAVLVALGRERAANLLEHFQQEEIRILLLITKELNNIPQEQLDELVEEFEAEFMAGTGLMDSSSTMQSIIEDALTPEQLAELQSSEDAVEVVMKTKSAWEILDEVEDEDLADFLMLENTQVAGFILSRISSDRSAQILSSLDNDARRRIVSAMISSRPVLPEAKEMLERILKEKFGRSIGKDKGAGSRRLVAGIMNELDQETSESLFNELAGTVEQTALQSLKSMMFRFDDLLLLEPAARAVIFDQVPTEVTTLALRETTTEMIEAVLSTLGQRSRRMLESELATESSASPEEVIRAQRQIASTALKLAGEGTINLPSTEQAA